MSIVFDTCCLMDGLLGYDNFAASIIRLQTQGLVTFALSETLIFEYVFIPFKIADNKNIDREKAYLLSKKIARVLSKNSDIINVKTKGRYVLNDEADDMLIHLAIDSNSPYIVTSNSSDFKFNEVKKATTKNGIEISILSPYQFYTYYQLKKLKFAP